MIDLWDECEDAYKLKYGKPVNTDVVSKIFERADHHIISNKTQAEKKDKTKNPPSDAQLQYATDLGIRNPESYSKSELAEKIDEAKKAKYS